MVYSKFLVCRKHDGIWVWHTLVLWDVFFSVTETVTVWWLCVWHLILCIKWMVEICIRYSSDCVSYLKLLYWIFVLFTDLLYKLFSCSWHNSWWLSCECALCLSPWARQVEMRVYSMFNFDDWGFYFLQFYVSCMSWRPVLNAWFTSYGAIALWIKILSVCFEYFESSNVNWSVCLYTSLMFDRHIYIN